MTTKLTGRGAVRLCSSVEPSSSMESINFVFFPFLSLCCFIYLLSLSALSVVLQLLLELGEDATQSSIAAAALMHSSKPQQREWDPSSKMLKSKEMQFRKEPICACRNECSLYGLNLPINPPACWQLSETPTLWQKRIIKKSLTYAWFSSLNLHELVDWQSCSWIN